MNLLVFLGLQHPCVILLKNNYDVIRGPQKERYIFKWISLMPFEYGIVAVYDTFLVERYKKSGGQGIMWD